MEWYEHPVLQDMLKVGCSDRIKIMLAFQTYMKLCEVDRLWEIEFFYNKHLDIIYVSSTDKKEKVLHVPVSSQQQLSPAWFHSISCALQEKHSDAIVNIVLKTPDTSLLTYKLTEGLYAPPTPDSTKEKKALKEKIQYVQSELNKRKLELFEEAKNKRIKPSGHCSNSSEEVVKLEETVTGEEL